MTKLAPAKDWRNRPVDKWLVTSFTEYMRDKHKELFGIDYVPFGGTWGMEQGILGGLIGTKSRTNPKPRTASNEAVKKFIDETFENYVPSKSYPGTNLGFMWTYRKHEWQKIQAEEVSSKRKQEQAERAYEEHGATEIEALDEWWEM